MELEKSAPNDEIIEKTVPQNFKLSGCQKKTEWTSIYIAALITFFGAVQYSIYFSSLWPYLQILDKTATETFFGIIISCYSVGQMIASPLTGYWSNKTRKMRHPLHAGLTLMLIGNILYFFTPLLPSNRKYSILIARLITGCGSANVSLLKSFATNASTGNDRSKAIAYVTGGLALGSVIGPAFQLMFTPIGPKGIQIYHDLRISMYTCPALLASSANIAGMLMLVFLFKEAYVGVPDKETMKKSGFVVPPYDRLAVGLCHITRFCQMFIVTNLESIGTPLAMTTFALNRSTVVQYTSTTQGIIGLLGFSTYASYIKFNLGKKFNDRLVTVLSLTGLILFHLFTYSWSFYSGHLITYNNQDLINANGSELVGCNTDRFDWCNTFKPVNIYVYYITYALFIGTCFPNINISLNTLFSKLLGPRPQAAQQGWLQVSGASARMIGPIVISALYTHFGPKWSWDLEIGVISLTLILWIILRNRMVPLQVPLEFAEFQDKNDQVKKSKKLIFPKSEKELRNL